MKKILLILTVALLVVITPFSIAIASDIADAVFFGTVRASNNSTVAQNVSANLSINSAAWIANGTLNTGANNTAIRNSTGADTGFMPGYNDNPWIAYFNTVPNNGSIDFTLYTGVTGGKIRYFPGSGGMAVSDDASLEPGDNFTVSLSGFVDTSAGANKKLVDKPAAFRVFVSPDVSGNITALTNTVGAPDNETDGTISGPDVVWSGGKQRTGQRFNSFAGLITEAKFYLRTENGNPTGTGYGRVRNAVTDAIIGVLGSVDISTINAIAWFTFPDDVEVVTPTDIRVSFEWDGGDAGNNIGSGFRTADTIAGFRTTFDDPTWTDSATDDRNIDIDFIPFTSFVAVSAIGLSTQEQTVKASLEPVLDFVSANGDFAEAASSNDLHFNTGGVDEPFSISTWVNMEDISSSTLVAKNDAASEFEYSLSFISTDHLLFRLQTTAGDRLSMFGDRIFTNLEGQWINIIATYDGSESNTGMTLYLNGLAMTANASSLGSYTGMPLSAAKTTIGAFSGGGSQNIDGKMAETRFYDVELSDAEALSLFNGTAPKETDLAAYWQINDNIDTLADRSGNGITLTNNGADWVDPGLLKIYIDDSLYNLAEGVAVPSNSENWTFVRNNSMIYMETANITIDGVLQGSWEWEYGATFTDDSGNGNTATPTFRITSSDADVSASLITFKPISIAKVTDNTSITWPVIMEDPPDEPSTAYSENITPGIFFAPFVHTIAEFGASNWSGATTDMLEQLFWYTFAFIIIIGVSVSVYFFFAANAKEALFVKIFATAAIMIFFALPGINIYGLYVPLYYVFFATGILMLKKDFGW